MVYIQQFLVINGQTIKTFRGSKFQLTKYSVNGRSPRTGGCHFSRRLILPDEYNLHIESVTFLGDPGGDGLIGSLG